MNGSAGMTADRTFNAAKPSVGATRNGHRHNGWSLCIACTTERTVMRSAGHARSWRGTIPPAPRRAGNTNTNSNRRRSFMPSRPHSPHPLLPTSHWLAGSRPSNFTTALHSPSHHRTRGRSAGHWTPRPALGNERDSNSADLCCVERRSAVWNAAKDTRNNQQLPRLQHILAALAA